MGKLTPKRTSERFLGESGSDIKNGSLNLFSHTTHIMKREIGFIFSDRNVSTLLSAAGLSASPRYATTRAAVRAKFHLSFLFILTSLHDQIYGN